MHHRGHGSGCRWHPDVGHRGSDDLRRHGHHRLHGDRNVEVREHLRDREDVQRHHPHVLDQLRDEQGRVQGAASAVESLGRTVGPVWGNASLQRFGEGMPFVSAAAFLLLTFALTVGYRVVSDPDTMSSAS